MEPGSSEFFIVVDRVETTLDKQMKGWKMMARNATMTMDEDGVHMKMKKKQVLKVKEVMLKRRLEVVLEIVAALRYLHENK